MVFSSLEFLFLYLPITLLLYYLIPHRHRKWRNLVLLVMSLIFYGWGEPVYVFLMMFTITVDYVCVYFVDKYRDTDQGKSKTFLILSICINLATLGFFKYYDFIVTNLHHIPGLGGLPLLGLSLPLGISFYTFHALSYVIDVYKRDAKIQKNVITFGTYVTMFPSLIAGPIIRYRDVDEQLRERKESVALFASGVRTFLAGMAKKVFLANIAGQMWANFRDLPVDQRSVIGCWIGMLCYAFQIYFDFSGYSDMALGLGKMLGFKFLENFNYPYVAKSITDFWRRWHMSLSTWFREYVYFPLGGSRCSKFKNYRNILIVWFLTGFWHGASWNFILWGLYYCALLIIEKAFLLKLLPKIPSFFQHFYALFFIFFGWLLFVFEDFGAGATYLSNMFGGGGVGTALSQINIYDISRNLLFFVIMIIACTPLPKKLFYKFYEKSQVFKLAAYAGGAVVLIFSIAYLVDSSYNPFLYFRF